MAFIAASKDEGANELYVSPQIESLLGFHSGSGWRTRCCGSRSCTPTIDPAGISNSVRPHLPTGEPFQSDYRFIAPTAHDVGSWRGQAGFGDDQGQPLCLQGVAFDLTAIKEAEAELKAMNQTLERRVAERTAIAGARPGTGAIQRGPGAVWIHYRPRPAQPLRTIKSYTQELAELLREEMLGFFCDTFAGRELEPISTPAEFAALRERALMNKEK